MFESTISVSFSRQILQELRIKKSVDLLVPFWFFLIAAEELVSLIRQIVKNKMLQGLNV